MGPRPFGRGMGDPAQPILLPSLASMGPRPFGRGMGSDRATGAALGHASMGPRPFGRGMCAHGPCYKSCEKSFNGAATFRSRNGGAGARKRKALPASMGPRPFGRGMLPLLIPLGLGGLLLQWGRDLSVAEWTGSEPVWSDRRQSFNGAATFRSRNADIIVARLS